VSNAAVAVPVTVHRPLAPEEAARADFYALLSRLLSAPPDGALLRNLAEAPALHGDADVAKAWDRLTRASSAMDADAAGAEFDLLFAGVGKAVVSLYAGFYAGASAVDHPRVRIQHDLAALGLALRDDRTEPEDHFSGLFEAMRVLIAGGAGRGPASVEEQRRFFDGHLAASAPKLFVAMGKAAEANYYRTVAAFGGAFIALESESLHLD
jgi:TorA maturation chaperone TorD